MTTVVAPCKLPCPKCGSDDVHREHHANGSKWDVVGDADGYCARNKYAARHSHRAVYATREHIAHHCRTCQFDWQGAPLRKPKPPPKWKPCEICANHDGCRSLSFVRNDPKYCGAER